SVPPAQVKSTWETSNNSYVSRDCGYSQALPSGDSFWLFCDSQFYASSGQPYAWGFVPYGTAAKGPVIVGLVPDRLVEVATPKPNGSAPGPFLPAPVSTLHKAYNAVCTTTGSDKAY